MAKGDKVSGSLTGMSTSRPSPKYEKNGGKVDFSYGEDKIKANPLNSTFDSRPLIGDNKPGANRWPMGEKNLPKENAGRKSHSFGKGASSNKDQY